MIVITMICGQRLYRIAEALWPVIIYINDRAKKYIFNYLIIFVVNNNQFLNSFSIKAILLVVCDQW